MIKANNGITKIEGNAEEIIADTLGLLRGLTELFKASPELAIAIVNCDRQTRTLEKFVFTYTDILREENEKHENN